MLSIPSGGISSRTYNHRPRERGARRLAALEQVNRFHGSREGCREAIKNQYVILLNNFNKIHESGMRHREYYLLKELPCSCRRVVVSQPFCTV